MTPTEVASVLNSIGCPSEKCLEMATQLTRRAEQLSKRSGKSREESMAHLLQLMKQGWAAKEKSG